MPTYIYETLRDQGGNERFELRQSIHEPALTRHPRTGEPVRRVISGGIGFLKVRSRGSAVPANSGPHPQNCCPGCHD